MSQKYTAPLNAIVFLLCATLMAALILPSIARHRAHARSFHCSNNLKQIGLAIHNYHSAYKRLPQAMGGTTGNPADDKCNKGRLGFLVALTPFIEQQQLWEQIANPYVSPAGKTFQPMGPVPWYDEQEYLPWAKGPNVYRCPDQPGNQQPKKPKVVYTLEVPRDGIVGLMTNYVASYGDGTHMIGRRVPEHDQAVAPNDLMIHQRAANRGMFVPGQQLRFRDILDGLSNTIMASETISSVEGKRGLSGVAKDIEDLANNPSLCLNVLKDNDVQWWESGRGSRWSDGTLAVTGFQTVLPPNSPSCADRGLEDCIVSASSNHEGGVHALMGDGAVGFITNTIDAGDPTSPGVHRHGAGNTAPGQRSPFGVWGALGSRANKERLDNFRLNTHMPRAAFSFGGSSKPKRADFTTWTDKTGKTSLSAVFVRIIDKKTIELQDNMGVLHQVPLNSLRDNDIFRAVMKDLNVEPMNTLGRGRDAYPGSREIMEYERAMVEEAMMAE